MSQSNIQGRNYVRSSTGLWTPVGFASGDTQIPVALTNPSLSAIGVYAGLSGYGAQRVTTEPIVLFNDPFDGTLDAQRWSTAGTVAPTVLGGRAMIEPGATLSASSALVSTASFVPPGSSFQGLGLMQSFENAGGGVGAPGYLNSHRFFGFGTVPTTWTTAYTGSDTSGPMRHAWGFEIDTDGHMYACVYDSGIRVRADAIGQAAGEKRLSLGRNLFNGETHQFTLVLRADAVFWYINGQDLPAAVLTYRSASFPIPDVQSLPVRLHTINSGTAPSGTMWHRPAAIAVADTGSNNGSISDPTYPWRRAKVDAGGALAVAGRPADNAVSATAAVGNGVTATLTAVAGLYHYITGISITRYATASLTASSTPPVVATTNLPGSLGYVMATNLAMGATSEHIEDLSGAPLRSSVAGTATTFAAPAATNVIWRLNVMYYTAP